jgi:hypothetical protein
MARQLLRAYAGRNPESQNHVSIPTDVTLTMAFDASCRKSQRKIMIAHRYV